VENDQHGMQHVILGKVIASALPGRSTIAAAFND
jgi:hypothetical protein